MSIDLSCTDWIDRLTTGRSLVPDLALNQVQAARAVAVFNKLRLADVPGTPTLAEAGGDWFRDIVRALWGSLDPVTRARAIRELFLLVPKKNSKTTNGALMMLTALLLNERPNANFIMTAPVQDVAEIAFEAVHGAIALDPVLDKKLHVRAHLKTIVHRESKAELQIMTFDPSVLTGQKCHGVLIDELHVVAKMSKAPSALRQLRGGMLPFPEAFLAIITTQSEDQPTGIFRNELNKARRIRDGKQPGAMLPVLYEFPAEIQRSPGAEKGRELWRNPEIWHLVTPNAGKSIEIPRLVEEMQTAAATSDEELRAWCSQHLNIEIGLALSADGWPGADFWEDNADETMTTLDALLERSEVVTIGIDGGGLDDLLGVSVVGREIGTGRWLHWGHAWMHPIALERRKSEEQLYRDLEADGDLTIVEEIGDDVEEVADVVEKCEKAGLLDELGVDSAGIGSIVDAIVARKVDESRIKSIPQGWKLTGAIHTTERKLAGRALLHCGQRLFAWSAGNAKVEPRGNAIMITKQTAGRAKIDPLMSLFNAVALMSLNPKAKKKKHRVFFVGGG